MAVGRRLFVAPALRRGEVQIIRKGIRTEIKHLSGEQKLLELTVRDAVRRPEGLHADGDGTVHADGVGHLDLAAVGETGGDDVLRGIARIVSGARSPPYRYS